MNPSEFPGINNSIELLKRAEYIIPSATQTLAKGPTQHVRGISPNFVTSAKGALLTDVDNNEYIDCSMAIGPISIGYCNKEVNDSIKRQLDDGITFSLMHPLEVEVAELISSIIPNAKSVRFSKTGCDVTSAAIRLARAFTGRDKILTCGYHGWHDWYISNTSRSNGIPSFTRGLVKSFTYNDINSLASSLDSEVAAVIMEPMLFEYPDNYFLQNVKELTTANKSLLIFDEMWTGFRIALGGAQEKFDVDADMCTFSKAVANGMPLSILTGRKDILSMLDQDLFFYTTFGGEALSLAAAKATIQFMQSTDFFQAISAKGIYLKNLIDDAIKSLSCDFIQTSGMPQRFIVLLDHKTVDNLTIKSILQQEMIRNRVLWQGQFVICYEHTYEQLDKIGEAFRSSLSYLMQALKSNCADKYLHGSPVEPVFRTIKG